MDCTSLSNDIITRIGLFNSTNTLFDEVQSIQDQLVNVTGGSANWTGVNYILLANGTNTIALPTQPSNTSISFVAAGVEAGTLIRIDWYNETGGEWLVYNPDNPFEQTLDTMETGKAYRIWMENDGVLFVP